MKRSTTALRRVVVEEEFDVPVSVRRGGRAAKKHGLFIRVECDFNIAGVGGDGLREFRAVVHREIGTFASEGRHQVRCIGSVP